MWQTRYTLLFLSQPEVHASGVKEETCEAWRTFITHGRCGDKRRLSSNGQSLDRGQRRETRRSRTPEMTVTYGARNLLFLPG